MILRWFTCCGGGICNVRPSELALQQGRSSRRGAERHRRRERTPVAKAAGLEEARQHARCNCPAILQVVSWVELECSSIPANTRRSAFYEVADLFEDLGVVRASWEPIADPGRARRTSRHPHVRQTACCQPGKDEVRRTLQWAKKPSLHSCARRPAECR